MASVLKFGKGRGVAVLQATTSLFMLREKVPAPRARIAPHFRRLCRRARARVAEVRSGSKGTARAIR